MCVSGDGWNSHKQFCVSNKDAGFVCPSYTENKGHPLWWPNTGQFSKSSKCHDNEVSSPYTGGKRQGLAWSPVCLKPSGSLMDFQSLPLCFGCQCPLTAHVAWSPDGGAVEQ